MLSFILNLILVVVVLGVLITIHELGHFISAKLSKVRVDEFAIGMGPAIFSREYKGTKYSLRALPIGGYVKIFGEMDEDHNRTDLSEKEIKKIEADKKSPNNFQNKSVLTKIFILSAGVTLNLLTAVIIYYGFLIKSDFEFTLPNLNGYTPIYGEFSRVKVVDQFRYELQEGGEASKAGWPEKGYISGVEGENLEYTDELISFINNSGGKDVVVTICNEFEDGKVDANNCAPYETKIGDDGKLGIRLGNNFYSLIKYEGAEKVFAGFTHSVNIVQLGIFNIREVFSEASDTGNYDEAVNSVSGPIGLYFIVDFIKDYGIEGVLDLVANLSLTLFIMNLLPIPALDGGRIVLVLLEKAMGRFYSKTIETWVIQISFILLLILMLSIIIKDIVYIDRLKELFK